MRNPCFIINSVYLLFLSEHGLEFFIELSIGSDMAFLFSFSVVWDGRDMNEKETLLRTTR